MFKQLLLIFAITSFTLFSTEAQAKRVQVDTEVTAQNGCKFRVTGWVEVGLSFSGVTVNDYDITLDGDCGHFRFEGLVAAGGGGGVTIFEGKLLNRDTQQYEDVSSSPFLGSSLVELEKYCNEQ